MIHNLNARKHNNLVANLLVSVAFEKPKLRFQDVMKASPKLIREWARAKLHPNFNSAFAELGMPFDPEQARFEGNEKTIMAGIKAGHYKKTQRILDALLGQFHTFLFVFLSCYLMHGKRICTFKQN